MGERAPFRVLAIDGTDVHGPTEVRDTAVNLPAGGRVDIGLSAPPDRDRQQPRCRPFRWGHSRLRAMMAAMMLPGAAPAVLQRVEETGRVRAVPAFLAGYLAVWTLVGVAVYACYRPHGAAVAGVLAIVAGGYELTPAKRCLRRCCQDGGRSGLRFGLCCVGSGLGLTVLLVALGVMSIGWMAVIAFLSLAQKLLPHRPTADIPVALAIVGLGVLDGFNGTVVHLENHDVAFTAVSRAPLPKAPGVQAADGLELPVGVLVRY